MTEWRQVRGHEPKDHLAFDDRLLRATSDNLDVVAGNISRQESVSQSLNQVIGKFVKVVPVALYGSETGVFLCFEMFQKSSENLSHNSSPLHRFWRARYDRIRTLMYLAENTIQLAEI
jgi:hypothetical protein